MRLAVWILLGGSALWGQASPPASVEQGRAVYRSNCAFCHGLTGRGGRGPNIAIAQLNQGNRDEDLRRVVTEGVPGTSMPAFPRMEPHEMEELIAFIRHLQGSGAPPERVAGDPRRGRQLYVKTGCPTCHRVGEEGSDYGPDLSRAGAARSVEYLAHSITDPSGEIPENYEGVSVMTRDGRRLTGIRINEDTFTVQIRDISQKIHMFDKAELKEVIHEKKSLMPAYQSLAKRDLDDMLAYLVSLRGAVRTGSEVKEVKGIQ
jgi:putative heme-binding domain-containing protein